MICKLSNNMIAIPEILFVQNAAFSLKNHCPVFLAVLIAGIVAMIPKIPCTLTTLSKNQERGFNDTLLIPSNIRLPINAWNKNNRMITRASRLFHFLTFSSPSLKTDQNVLHVPVTASLFHCIV